MNLLTLLTILYTIYTSPNPSKTSPNLLKTSPNLLKNQQDLTTTLNNILLPKRSDLNEKPDVSKICITTLNKLKDNITNLCNTKYREELVNYITKNIQSFESCDKIFVSDIMNKVCENFNETWNKNRKDLEIISMLVLVKFERKKLLLKKQLEEKLYSEEKRLKVDEKKDKLNIEEGKLNTEIDECKLTKEEENVNIIDKSTTETKCSSTKDNSTTEKCKLTKQQENNTNSITKEISSLQLTNQNQNSPTNTPTLKSEIIQIFLKNTRKELQTALESAKNDLHLMLEKFNSHLSKCVKLNHDILIHEIIENDFLKNLSDERENIRKFVDNINDSMVCKLSLMVSECEDVFVECMLN